MLTIDEALKEALEPPDHYWGPLTDLVTQGWAQVAGRHRDSDILGISNFEAMLEHYNEKYEVNEDFRVEGASHWLVGWSDTLLVRALQCKCEDWEDADIYSATKSVWHCGTCGTDAQIRPIFNDALDFAERLDNYPVLDEEDFSRREHEELLEYIDNEIHSAANVVEEETGKELGKDYWMTAEAIASYLFDTYSVSHVDDIENEWIVEATKELASL